VCGSIDPTAQGRLANVSPANASSTPRPRTISTGSWGNWPPVRQRGRPLRSPGAAIDEVEEEEDEHLYQPTGWPRELWLQSLGIKAVLPPTEEQKYVTTAIGAARAKNAREETPAREN
jgi:hypothetical protein